MNYDFLKLLIYIVTILTSLAYAAQAQSAPETKSAPVVLRSAKEINGAWQLNAGQSDNAAEKAAAMLAAQPEQTEQINAADTQMPSISISLYHPESVVIAAGDNSEMTINQGYTDVVQTKTVITDGAARFYEVSPGVNFSVTATKQKGVLRVETVSPRGNKMIEIFAPAPDGKLSVSMRLETSSGKEIITMHRVYDRMISDIFSAGDDEMQ